MEKEYNTIWDDLFASLVVVVPIACIVVAYAIHDATDTAKMLVASHLVLALIGIGCIGILRMLPNILRIVFIAMFIAWGWFVCNTI